MVKPKAYRSLTAHRSRDRAYPVQPPCSTHKHRANSVLIVLGGGGWIRTTEARASDLQSDPFGHSGTPPEGRTFSRCQGRVSTLNFTLKIPLYACVYPRFDKCVRAAVIFAPGSPRRLGSGGLRIESPPTRGNTAQPGDSSGCGRRQSKTYIEKKMELARGIEPPTG